MAKNTSIALGEYFQEGIDNGQADAFDFDESVSAREAELKGG